MLRQPPAVDNDKTDDYPHYEKDPSPKSTECSNDSDKQSEPYNYFEDTTPFWLVVLKVTEKNVSDKKDKKK